MRKPRKYHKVPDILLVKGVIRQMRRYKNIDGTYTIPFESLLKMLTDLRERMEKAWSNSTKYSGTIVSIGDPISKGQCGVTAAYLAKELEALNFDVLFCEGNVYFPNSEYSIYNHCWLKVLHIPNGLFDYYNVIIDLTSDQHGYEHKIIFEQDAKLKNASIFYTPIKEISPSNIRSENFKKRTQLLSKRLDSSMMI